MRTVQRTKGGLKIQKQLDAEQEAATFTPEDTLLN